MSAQSAERAPGPLFPMPPITEAALRVAVRRIDPSASVAYEQEFHAAWQEAVQTDSTSPMRAFLNKWAVWVSLHRFPDRSARLRELEREMGRAESRQEGRKIAAEIGELLKAAAAEVGAG